MGNFLDFLRESFFHVAPILVAAGFALAIIAERSKALYKTYPLQDAQGFYDKVRDLVMTGKTNEAIALCDKYPGKPAAQVIKAALLRSHQAETLIEHGLQIAVSQVTQQVQRRTSFLATIANVATLLGLFGTIAGLIHSFEAVGHADPQQKGALLAAGISTAMNATMLGLGVAIPCMVAFSFLMNKTNRLVQDIEGSAVHALDIIKQRYYSLEDEAFTGGSKHSSNGASNGSHSENVASINSRRAA